MRNAINISTVPYTVVGQDGQSKVLNERFMTKSELEDWICRVVASGNVLYASRIKLVHKLKVKSISEYMMFILGGTHPSSDYMKQTLKQAIEDLGINVKDLMTITPEQIVEAKNAFPNNAGKGKR